MAGCIYKYNRRLGLIFKFEVLLTIFLEKFVSARKARQIPMTPYLLMHIRREKAIRNRITPIE